VQVAYGKSETYLSNVFSTWNSVWRRTSAHTRLYPPYLKTEALSELRVPCQEILTNFELLGQETLTKNWVLQAFFVKKPLQKRFYTRKTPYKTGIASEKECASNCRFFLGALFNSDS
jgi:hypothetical protein